MAGLLDFKKKRDEEQEQSILKEAAARLAEASAAKTGSIKEYFNKINAPAATGAGSYTDPAYTPKSALQEALERFQASRLQEPEESAPTLLSGSRGAQLTGRAADESQGRAAGDVTGVPERTSGTLTDSNLAAPEAAPGDLRASIQEILRYKTSNAEQGTKGADVQTDTESIGAYMSEAAPKGLKAARLLSGYDGKTLKDRYSQAMTDDSEAELPEERWEALLEEAERLFPYDPEASMAEEAERQRKQQEWLYAQSQGEAEEKKAAERAELQGLTGLATDIDADYKMVFDEGKRPGTLINPFDGTKQLQDNKARLEQYLADVEPGSTNDQVNGEVARKALGEIDMALKWLEDPKMALAMVNRDLGNLYELKENPVWQDNGDLQQRIWQQERQKALLLGYITLNEAGDDARERAEYFRSQYEGTWALDLPESKAFLEEEPDVPESALLQPRTDFMPDSLKPHMWEYDDLTEEEKQAFWLLYIQDPEAAENFIIKMKPIAHKRDYEQEREIYRNLAENHPWMTDIGGTGLATLMETLKPAEGAIMLWNHYVKKGEIDQYDQLYGFSSSQGLIHAAVEEDIARRVKAKYGDSGEKAAKETYNILTNFLDNVTRNTFSLLWGMPAAGSTAGMALGTIPQNYTQVSESTTGVNQDKKMLDATLRATSEFVTEVLSDVHFFNTVRTLKLSGSTWKKIGTAGLNIVVGSGIESTTEALNDDFYKVIDDCILQEESPYNQSVDRYFRKAIAEGTFKESDNEVEAAMDWAEKQATQDHIANVLHTFWTSAISGGLMDVTGTVQNRFRNRVFNQGTETDTDTEIGNERDGQDTRTDVIPEDATGQTPEGKNLSGEQLRAALEKEKQAALNKLDAMRDEGTLTQDQYNGYRVYIENEYSEEKAADRIRRAREAQAAEAEQGEEKDEASTLEDAARGAEETADRTAEEELPFDETPAAEREMPKPRPEQMPEREQGEEEQRPAPTLEDVARETVEAEERKEAPETKPTARAEEEAQRAEEEARRAEEERLKAEHEAREQARAELKSRLKNIPDNAVGVDIDGVYYDSLKKLKQAMKEKARARTKSAREARNKGLMTEEGYQAILAQARQMYDAEYAQRSLELQRAENERIQAELARLDEEEKAAAERPVPMPAPMPELKPERVQGEEEHRPAPTLEDVAREAEEEKPAERAPLEPREEQKPEREQGEEEHRSAPTLEDVARETVEAEERKEAPETKPTARAEEEAQRAEEEARRAEEERRTAEQAAREQAKQELKSRLKDIPDNAIGVDIDGEYYDSLKKLKQGLKQKSKARMRSAMEALEKGLMTEEGYQAIRDQVEQMYNADYAQQSLRLQQDENERIRAELARLDEEEKAAAERPAPRPEQMPERKQGEEEHKPAEEEAGEAPAAEREMPAPREEQKPERTQDEGGITEEQADEAERIREAIVEDEDGNREYKEEENPERKPPKPGEDRKPVRTQDEMTVRERVVQDVEDTDSAGVVSIVLEEDGLLDSEDLDKQAETYDRDQNKDMQDLEKEEEEDRQLRTENQEGRVILDVMPHEATITRRTQQRSLIRWAEQAYQMGRRGADLNEELMPVSLRESAEYERIMRAARTAYEAGRAEAAADRQRGEEMTREVAQRYGYGSPDANRNGVSLLDVRHNLTDAQDDQLRILDAFGRRYGMQFRVYDSLGQRNAAYRGGRTVDISLAAEGGATVRAASHEAYHYIREYNSQAADEIGEYVLQRLQQTQGYDLTQRIAEVNNRYMEAGETTINATDEIVADSMIDVLASEDIVTRAMSEKAAFSGTLNKLGEHIQRVGTWLRTAVQRLAGHSAETRALSDDAQYVQEIGRRMVAAVEQATYFRRAREGGGDMIMKDRTGIANKFYDRVENGFTWGNSVLLAIDDLYQKVVLDRDGVTREGRGKARQEMLAAMNEFVAGEKSLNKALEDHGFKALEGADLDLAVWLARRAEQGREASAKEQEARGQASVQYDDFTDWILSTEGQFAFLDDNYQDFKARDLIHKLVQMTKLGIEWAGQEEKGQVKAGEWSSRLKGFVETLKAQTKTRMGKDAIESRIRSMYLALDNALLKGDDLSIGMALQYAEQIAEEITDRAGFRTGVQDDYLASFANYLRHTTIYLTEAQQDEAIRQYDSVKGLIRHYYGSARFTTNKAKAGTTLEDLAQEYAPLFDGGAMAEGELFNRLDTLLDQYAKDRDQARSLMYEGGLNRSQMEQDLTMRIIWGYFNLDGSLARQAEQATRGKTKTEEDFRNAIREARKEFDTRRAELEAEYAKLMDKNNKRTQEEIDQQKRHIEAVLQLENDKYMQKYRDALTDAQNRMTAAEQAAAEANVRLQAAIDQTQQMQADMEQKIQDRVEQYRQQLQKMNQSMIDIASTQKAKDAINARLSAMADAARKNVERREAMRRLTKLQTALLRPTDKLHVPEKYRAAIRKALSLVDTGNLRAPQGKIGQGTVKFRELQSILEEMDRQEPGALIDPDMAVNLQNLEALAKGKKLVEMDQQELEMLNETLAGIQAMMDHYDQSLTEANTQITKKYTERIRAIAENAVARKRPKTALGRAIRDQVEGSLMDPKRWTQWLGRVTETDIGDGIWGILHGGLEQQIRDVAQAEEIFADVMKGVNKKKLATMYGKNAETLTLHTMAGDVQLSIGQVMEIYMGMKRQQYEQHLLGVMTPKGRVGGGITIAQTDTRKGSTHEVRPIHVTEEQVRDLVGQLTPEQKALADKMKKVLDYCSKIGNETSMRLYGYEKFKEKNYYPIKVNRNYTSQTINQDFSNPLYRLKNQGMTKNLVEKANAPIDINNIFDTVPNHVVEMINYHAWVAPMMDMTRILNNANTVEETDENGNTFERRTGTTAEDLEVLMGQNGKSYLLQLLRDINGIAADEIEKKAANLPNMMLSRFKASAVSWNFSTMMKQPWSVVRGFDVIPSHYFLPGRARGCTGNITELMKQYAPIYIWKQYGNFTMDTGKSLQAILLPQTQTVGDVVSEAGMKGAAAADNLTWKNIWRAAEKMTAARHTDLQAGSEEFNRQVAHYFNECIDQTQVVDSILHRTQIMRSKGIWTKMATSFMGEPLKSFNTFMDKARALADNPTAENKKAFARTATVYGASAAVQAIVASVISALRHMGDDEPTWDKIKRYLFGFGNAEEWKDANIWEKIWKVYTSNIGNEFSLISKVPWLRDALEKAKGYDVERADMSVISEVFSKGETLLRALGGEGNVALPKAALDFLGMIGNAFGIPTGNIVKEIYYGSNWIPRGLEEAFGVNTIWLQFEALKAARTIGATGTANEYIALMVKAKEAGDMGMYEKIQKELIAHGYSQEKIDKKLQGIAAADLGLGTKTAEMAHGYVEALASGDKERAEEIHQAYLVSGKEDGWNTAVMQQVRTLPQVKEAADARRAGDITRAEEVVGELREMGIPETVIIKAMRSAMDATEENGEIKWGSASSPISGEQISGTENAATAGVWAYSDLAAVVQEGNLDDASTLIGYMRQRGTKDSNIKSGLTNRIKPIYVAAVQAGDLRKADDIMDTLLRLDLGYTEKAIEGWAK